MFHAINVIWETIGGFFTIMSKMASAGQRLANVAELKAAAYEEEESIRIKANLEKVRKELAKELASLE